MRIYKIMFCTKERNDQIEYIISYTAQEARNKVSEMHPDCFNLEILERYN